MSLVPYNSSLSQQGRDNDGMAVIGTNAISLTQMPSCSANVPQYAICQLSYFIRCATKDCNVDILENRYYDYHRAHLLSREDQAYILLLATTLLSLEVLSDVTVFVDDDNNVLPRGAMNKWYQVEQVSHLLAVQSNVALLGKETKVTKILICNSSWLRKFYVEPLERIGRTGSMTAVAFGSTRVVDQPCECVIL